MAEDSDDLYDDNTVRTHNISPGGGWPYERLIPPIKHEIEFKVCDILKHQEGEKVRSYPHTFGNFRCRILCFPMGTKSPRGSPSLAAFVEAEALPEIEEDPRWTFNSVKYSVTLINQLDYSRSVVKTDTWSFSKEGIDRGWHSFVLWKDLIDESQGWMKDETIILRAQISVRHADTLTLGSDYDSRKEAGCIGLRNHGATCYLNGLLQSLYFVGKFREMVYSIDCSEDDSTSLIKALQNVVYQLQTASSGAVNCRELMKSFGWDSVDAFQQHDAQELNRILCDRLEEKLKGTKADGKIKSFFEGEFENYIECTDVSYCSRRDETFYDLQLNVRAEDGRALGSLEESLKDLCREEILEGENAYDAGPEYGKQRARKGIRFKRFPPVLNLQLKRFTFDLETLDMVKLNDLLEFPRELDLGEFVEDGGVYTLAAVVVHTGTVSSGHYYAFVRPMEVHTSADGEETGAFGRWLKFDDESVTRCTEWSAINDNYGGEDPMVYNYYSLSPEEIEKRGLNNGKFPTTPRIHNAYIITYVRADMAFEIMRPPEPNEELIQRFKKEADAKERQRHDQQTRVTITIILEKDLLNTQPCGFWDLGDPPATTLPPMEMSKDQSTKELWTAIDKAIREAIPTPSGSKYQLNEQSLGIFVLRRRNNRQVRFSFLSHPSISKNLSMESASYDGAMKMTILVITPTGFNPMTLKWEPEIYNPEHVNDPPDDLSAWKDERTCLVLNKYFCPVRENIVFLGSFYGRYEDESINMRSWVERRIKLGLQGAFGDPLPIAPLEEPIGEWQCWEEFSITDIRNLSVYQTMKDADLFSGDILVWQISTGKLEETKAIPSIPVVCKNVPDFASMMANKITVRGILHSLHEPLCVEGVIADGVWEDIERPSPRCQKEEIEMDLRWNMSNAFNLFAQKFDIPGEELWAFRSSPSCTFDEPWLPCRLSRSKYRALKDLGWTSPSTPQKRPTVHLVHVPMCSWTKWRQIEDSETPLECLVTCVRFFDQHVREVGNCFITVDEDADVKTVIQEALNVWTLPPDPSKFSVHHCTVKKIPVDDGTTNSHTNSASKMEDLQMDTAASGGLPEAFKDLKLENIRVSQCYGINYNRNLEIVSHDTKFKKLQTAAKANILYSCLRIEPIVETQQEPNTTNILCYHAERQGSAFGHPMWLQVRQGDTIPILKEKIQKKLLVPNQDYRNWRICRVDSPNDAFPNRNVLRDDENPESLWTFVNGPLAKLWLEHSHPTLRFGDQTPKPKPKPRGLVIK